MRSSRSEGAAAGDGAEDGVGIGFFAHGARRRHGSGGLRRRAEACPTFGQLADRGEGRADGHAGARLDKDLIEGSLGKHLDVDHALVGIYLRDHVAPADSVPRLLSPADERAGLHVGSEGGHREGVHGDHRQAATIRSTLGRAASSSCLA